MKLNENNYRKTQKNFSVWNFSTPEGNTGRIVRYANTRGRDYLPEAIFDNLTESLREKSGYDSGNKTVKALDGETEITRDNLEYSAKLTLMLKHRGKPNQSLLAKIELPKDSPVWPEDAWERFVCHYIDINANIARADELQRKRSPQVRAA